ncbi:MAG: UDP-N-acetylglucosamine 2-epimerase (non-hydrolyzing) [Chloracidobacterium sp.]|nr:UDP-N-acetylglucosamine 2-epimerase (non-hydrolyzing) [Chloracidobacterium sp.]
MFDNAPERMGMKSDLGTAKKAKILVLFGTRPEVIKFAPVIDELKNKGFETLVVSSSQHKHLLKPFLDLLKVNVDLDLDVMRKDQTPNDVCSRVIAKLDRVLADERPDLLLVQGDTTTTLAGALAAFNRRIPVGHIEAGLRSGDLLSPFPEEANRRLVTQVASLHFAATEKNRRNLTREGVPSEKIFVTGNPVVDALRSMLKNLKPSDKVSTLIDDTAGKKRLLLTTHRRESFGSAMTENLRTIRDFIAKHGDTCLLFPVHPNPNVKGLAEEILRSQERVYLLEPLDYSDFLSLMKRSWLILSDSGGVQEEAPSLGKPLLVLRENTERPEGLRAGVSKLVGDRPSALRRLLEENYSVDTWIRSVKEVANPFGDGKAATRIVRVIEQKFGAANARHKAALNACP